MTPGHRVVAAARAAVGAKFRLHGRAVADGFDCIGLAAHALAAGGFAGPVPTGYALRGGVPHQVAAMLDAAGLVRVGDTLAGDVLLLATGPGQLHLAIATEDGCIHADALLRRVVERPGAIPWPILGRWRLADSTNETGA